jgi:hypothetical protein
MCGALLDATDPPSESAEQPQAADFPETESVHQQLLQTDVLGATGWCKQVVTSMVRATQETTDENNAIGALQVYAGVPLTIAHRSPGFTYGFYPLQTLNPHHDDSFIPPPVQTVNSTTGVEAAPPTTTASLFQTLDLWDRRNNHLVPARIDPLTQVGDLISSQNDAAPPCYCIPRLLGIKPAEACDGISVVTEFMVDVATDEARPHVQLNIMPLRCPLSYYCHPKSRRNSSISETICTTPAWYL